MMSGEKRTRYHVDKKGQRGDGPLPGAEPETDPAPVATPPSGYLVATEGESLGRQAAWLGDKRLQGAQRQALLAQIGRVQGNRHVQRMVASRGGSGGPALTRPAAPAIVPTAILQRQMEDEGELGTGPVEGIPVGTSAKTADLREGQTNPWGEKDGLLTSDTRPHVFVSGGKTGSGIVHWVGGNGGRGNQTVAAISLTAPAYESEEPPSAASGARQGAVAGAVAGGALGSLLGPVGTLVGGVLGGVIGGVLGGLRGARQRAAAGPNPKAKAWIRPGSGRLTVTRSYRGALTGANGSTAYMTARGSTRVDAHEQLHVDSSRSIHDRLIKPLEERIARYTGRANAMPSSGTSSEQAERELQSYIRWNETIDAFRRADTAANTPMGTVDTNDLASPTYVRDYGPLRVGRTNYVHYYDTPPGPPAGGP
jgi:hypothetical protein